MKINTNALDLSDSKVGDSIAVDGVCLTVTQLSGDGFAAERPLRESEEQGYRA